MPAYVWAQTNAPASAPDTKAAPGATNTAAVASAPKPPPPPPLSPTEQTIKDIKNPASWFSWGGDLRLRNEYFNNAQTLTSDPDLSPVAHLHSQDYFRFRGRVWASIMPAEGLSLNARLAAEPREFMEPSSSGTYLNQSGMEWRYGIIDNLNIQYRSTGEVPIAVNVGRQDIFLGDGFLVGDGTPADGSWTYFLDAARLTLDFKESKTTVDMVAIAQHARADAWLPIIDHEEGKFLTDQDESGAILYVSNKTMPTLNIDGYFIYKHDSRITHAPAAGLGDDADIYTAGARLSGLVKEHIKYTVEGAYQFGSKEDPRLKNSETGSPGERRDINAFGVTSKLGYLLKDKMNSQAAISFEYLSGDKPGTDGDEMFDVLWGRWPRWSELYNIYSYIPEHRVGQTANVIRVGPSWTMNPIKDMDFSLSYNALFAEQEVPTRAGNLNLYTTDGNFRGHYVQSFVKYKFSRHLAGHLWGELVWPGDYYADRQLMTFLRAELMLSF
jgi:hypothetical protein